MTDLYDAALAMAKAAKLPGLVLVTDQSLGDNAEATGCYGHRLPVVRLGEDLMTGPEPIQYGVLAHELAHQELGHTTRVLPQALDCVSRIAVTLYVLTPASAWILDVYWWGSPAGNTIGAVTLAVLCVVAKLAARFLDRRAEYEADHHGVDLLNAAGLPGLDYMQQTVKDVAKDETPGTPRWAWLVHRHPSSSRRLAALK